GDGGDRRSQGQIGLGHAVCADRVFTNHANIQCVYSQEHKNGVPSVENLIGATRPSIAPEMGICKRTS
ncbi:MAG: hypothetical protein ACK5V9_08800, partial [Burkholderiales bacterium]